MALVASILERLARLARLAAFAALVSGLLWAWKFGRSLEAARWAGLALLAAAACLAVAGVIVRAAARWGGASADSDDSLFAAILLGGTALVASWVLGWPGEALPGPAALRTAQAVTAVLSVFTLGIAGLGLVLAAWAGSVREYLLGQLFLQSQVLAVLACLVTIWDGVRAALG